MELKRINLFDFFNGILMIFISFIMFYPMYYITMASLSDPYELSVFKGALWLPIKITGVAYQAVLSNPNIVSGYINTIIYVTVGTFISMLLTTLGGYAVSRKKLKWRNGFMFLMSFTMLFSGGLLPRYILVRQLGIMDTIWSIVLPGAISTMNLIIMRTAFANIPDSFEESAHIDGANDLKIFLKIALPLAQATIAVLTLYCLVGQWNSWFDASIYLHTRTKFPLQLIIRDILINSNTDAMSTSVGAAVDDKIIFGNTIKYATIMVSTLPVLAVYPFLQKYFVKGVMIGGIKG